MKIEFVAGFGPIARSGAQSLAFWSGALGLTLEEAAPGYFHTEAVAGVKAFAIWPLAQAAEATFGSPQWPADLPVPQAWIELDVASPQAVADAVAELRAAGHTVLSDAHEEPWGQTTSRLLSPEALLVGISHTPWMHGEAAP
ncbi:glyoxalase [uncultured Cellulomonas sp.]|uniref:glyoxalase n=1 Tax=uncultured Cellulomonas sp. TaxID=189682 RepID=UPI0026385BC3|nr:glyoxalase [uncultured Cellulomonas sp.]